MYSFLKMLNDVRMLPEPFYLDLGLVEIQFFLFSENQFVQFIQTYFSKC